MQRFVRLLLLAAATAAGGCDGGSVPEEDAPKRRWEYTQEDFGIGKPHTKNSRCNRDIDAQLEAIRACYNAREHAECSTLQQQNSDKIARLKNSRRCQR